MNAKSTISRQKLMAMGVVAMFVMCAFAICIPADSDAGPYGGVNDTSNGDRINQSYSVDISVGQTFTYDNITTNLDAADGNVEITGAPATTGNTATANPTFGNGTTGKKFTISFTTPGTYQYIITAKWTHNTETSLTQTATQTFNFTVSEKIALPTDATGYAIQNGTLNALSIPYSGPVASKVTVSKDVYSGTIQTTAGSTLFNAVISGNKLVVTPDDAVKNTVATYGLDITVTNNASKDSDTVHVTFQVFNDIVITAPAPDYTYEGDSGAPSTIEFITTWDAASGIQSVEYELTKDKDAGALKDVFEVGDGTGRVVTVSGIRDATIETIVPEGNTKIVYTATLKATATVGNGTSIGEGSESSDNIQDSTSKSDTKSTTLTVYKALAFASKPAIGDSAITPITAAGTSVNLSSYIKGAYNVVFDWGDGTQTSSMDNGNKTETTYGAYHTYAKSGLYTITVFATNDHGTSTAQILYNADEDAIDIPTDDTPSTDSDKKSFFDEHGYQFLIFAILTVLLMVAFFYFGFQSPMVIILAIVMAALAVLCFVYNDIGGVIDAVKGLFNKA